MVTRLQQKGKLQQQRQLNPKWTKDCPPEVIEDVEKRLKENADLFLLLDSIVKQKIDANTRERRSRKSYDVSAWSEYQADCNGYERALEEVRSYLQIIKEDENV